MEWHPAPLRRNARLASALAAISLLSTGCVSNPYVANLRPESSPLYASGPGSVNQRGTMEYAWVYGDITADAFNAKIQDEFTRQQNVSAGLFGLAGLALGLAGAHAHQDSLKLTGLIGGVTYQVSTWNTNPNRDDIYQKGIAAVRCAQQAVAPLRLRADSLTDIKTRESKLETAVNRAAVAAGELIAQAARVPSGDPAAANALEKARTSLLEYGVAMTEAKAAVERAQGLTTKINGAGSLLEGQINLIISSVNAAVKLGTKDLSALPAEIGNASKYAGMIVPGLDLGSTSAAFITSTTPSKAAATGTAPLSTNQAGYAPDRVPLDGLARALGALVAAVDELKLSIVGLSGQVALPSQEEVKVRMASCGNEVQPSTAMTLSPKVVNFKEGVQGLETVAVTPPVAERSVTALDALGAGVEVRGLPGGSVLVTATAAAKGGASYRIRVADKAAGGQSQEFVVNIAAKEKEVPPSASTAKTGGGECTHDKSPELVCLMQVALHVKADGKVGDVTCNAIKQQYPKIQRINDELIKAILLSKEINLSFPPNPQAVKDKVGELKLGKECGAQSGG